MLSIEDCRKLLGEDGKEMTDQRIIELRDSLQTICEKVLDKYLEENNQ